MGLQTVRLWINGYIQNMFLETRTNERLSGNVNTGNIIDQMALPTPGAGCDDE